MSDMTHDGLPLTPEQQAAQLLAYYDARGVSSLKLRQIFQCTDEALANARQGEDYTSFIAAEQARIEEESKEADDLWDRLERRALGDLSDAMDHVADPKTLLGIAVQANKASRRAGPMAAQQSKNHHAVINADQLAGPTKVVRLRTRFAQMLETESGQRRLVERTEEITEFSSGSLSENMDPALVKGLLRNSLGIDTSQMKVARTLGPDELAGDGTYVDFGNIMEALPEVDE